MVVLRIEFYHTLRGNLVNSGDFHPNLRISQVRSLGEEEFREDVLEIVDGGIWKAHPMAPLVDSMKFRVSSDMAGKSWKSPEVVDEYNWGIFHMTWHLQLYNIYNNSIPQKYVNRYQMGDVPMILAMIRGCQGTALVDAAEHLIGFVVYGVLHGAMWGTQWRARVGKSVGKAWENHGKTEEICCDSHDLGMEDFNTLVSTLMKWFSLSIFGSRTRPKVAQRCFSTLDIVKTGRDRVIIPGMNWVWLWKISLRTFWKMKVNELCPRIHWRENLQETHIFGVKTMVPYKLSYLSHFWFLMLSHVVLDVCVAWPGLATSQLCPVETHDV